MVAAKIPEIEFVGKLPFESHNAKWVGKRSEHLRRYLESNLRRISECQQDMDHISDTPFFDEFLSSAISALDAVSVSDLLAKIANVDPDFAVSEICLKPTTDDALPDPTIKISQALQLLINTGLSKKFAAQQIRTAHAKLHKLNAVYAKFHSSASPTSPDFLWRTRSAQEKILTSQIVGPVFVTTADGTSISVYLPDSCAGITKIRMLDPGVPINIEFRSPQTIRDAKRIDIKMGKPWEYQDNDDDDQEW